jgi:hypothetical protein
MTHTVCLTNSSLLIKFLYMKYNGFAANLKTSLEKQTNFIYIPHLIIISLIITKFV